MFLICLFRWACIFLQLSINWCSVCIWTFLLTLFPLFESFGETWMASGGFVFSCMWSLLVFLFDNLWVSGHMAFDSCREPSLSNRALTHDLLSNMKNHELVSVDSCWKMVVQQQFQVVFLLHLTLVVAILLIFAATSALVTWMYLLVVCCGKSLNTCEYLYLHLSLYERDSLQSGQIFLLVHWIGGSVENW